MLKIAYFQHFFDDFQKIFNFFFNIFFFNIFAYLNSHFSALFTQSLVTELFLCKWPSYRSFTAAKIVHLIADILTSDGGDPDVELVHAGDEVEAATANLKGVWMLINSEDKAISISDDLSGFLYLDHIEFFVDNFSHFVSQICDF